MKDRRAPYFQATVATVLLALGVYLAGNNLVGLWDRDEPRYAQTAKQMLQSDPPDWVVPRLLDNVRTAKPIFIYWCQMAAMRLMGAGDFAARLPSGLAIAATLLVVGLTLLRFAGAERAFWAVLILACSGLVMAAGKMAITDGVLLLWITIAQICLFAVYSGKARWKTALVMWIAIALAALTKGPVVLGVSLMTMLTLAVVDSVRLAVARESRPFPGIQSPLWKKAIRWWPRTRPLMGLLVVAVICSPWLWLIHQRAPGFLSRAIGYDVITRIVEPLEGHKGRFGFYFVSLWGTYMPWSLLLPATFIVGWRNLRFRTVRFAFAAAVGPWVMFEILQTKLIHYVLPIFPPLAFLTADLLVRCLRGRQPDLHHRLRMLPVSIWAGAVALLAFGGFVPFVKLPFLPSGAFPESRAELLAPATVIALLGLGWAAFVWWLWWVKALRSAMLAMAGGMMLVIVTFYVFYLPRADFLWLPQWAAGVLQREGATAKGEALMLDYQEDSLPWYQGGTIRAIDRSFDFNRPDLWTPWFALTRQEWDRTPRLFRQSFAVVASRRGWDYADRGKIVELMVVRRRIAPEAEHAPGTE
jgi:4-amino-4-deoxy-L-arabinose transferase-like glycosyltransferase